VNRDMSVIEQRVVPEELVRPMAELNRSFGLDTWVYRGFATAVDRFILPAG
jgi:hypothetical protein